MFWLGALNTYFTDRSMIPPNQRPKCEACGTELPKKASASRDSAGNITFWSFNCSKCDAPHIVFNV